jgi:hypothetical protein
MNINTILYAVYALTIILISIYLIKRSKIIQSDIAKFLISFVKLKLSESNIKTKHIELILDMIVQSILYTLSTNAAPNSNYLKNTNSAMTFIKATLPAEISLSLSKIEMDIIKNILMCIFILMGNIKMSEKITLNNHMNIYKISMKYMGNDSIQKLGLRQNIK